MKTLVLFLLLCLDVSAQTDYKLVETKPQFAGGTSALDSYFAKKRKISVSKAYCGQGECGLCD